MQKLIICDHSKCTGCGICELVCYALKFKRFNRTLSLIKSVRIKPEIDAALSCRLCESPPCVSSCPRGALIKSEQNGRILIDDDKCIGCKFCIMACDFGAITLLPSKGIVAICDLCEGNPLCVKYCPAEALKLERIEDMNVKKKLEMVKRLLI